MNGRHNITKKVVENFSKRTKKLPGELQVYRNNAEYPGAIVFNLDNKKGYILSDYADLFGANLKSPNEINHNLVNRITTTFINIYKALAADIKFDEYSSSMFEKIKSVRNLLKRDRKTGWLWLASFLGIVAFPPSVLFISEFLMIKTMLQQEKYILCILFLILLTIVLYGLAKAVIKMSFGSSGSDNDVLSAKRLSWTMYLPQIIMLILAFIIGIWIPPFISDIINNATKFYTSNKFTK
mgnify:CR=1 FL=1